MDLTHCLFQPRHGVGYRSPLQTMQTGRCAFTWRVPCDSHSLTVSTRHRPKNAKQSTLQCAACRISGRALNSISSSPHHHQGTRPHISTVQHRSWIAHGRAYVQPNPPDHPRGGTITAAGVALGDLSTNHQPISSRTVGGTMLLVGILPEEVQLIIANAGETQLVAGCFRHIWC